jgi:hypothetical protein
MAFTARTETYFNASSLSAPYDATHDKPASTAEGDILFALLCWYAASPPSIDSVPSGWNLLALQSGSGGADRWALYYKVAGASEPSSYTWSFSASAKVRIVCSCYTAGDFNPSDPIDVVSNTLYQISDAIVRAAAMTVANANSPLVFWASIYSTATKSFTEPSSPGTWVEDDDTWNTTPDFGNEICSQIWPGSGDTGAMDATCSATLTAKHAFAVALNPAGGQNYQRSGTALLGLLGSGTRGLGLTRSKTGLLGLLPSGTRSLGLSRSNTALLGLKGIASRTIALTRVNTALLGLKGIGLAARLGTIKTDCLDESTWWNSQRKLVRTSDGILHSVYHRIALGYSHIFHSYSSDKGQTWTEEALTSGDYGQADAAIAIDSQDNLHVVWYGSSASSPSYLQIRYRKYDGSWGAIVELTSESYHQYTPSLAIGSNDHLHIVWHGRHSGSPSYDQIRYIKYDGSWGTIGNLTSGNYQQSFPAIGIDENNYLHVTWHGKHSGSTTYYQIRYVKYTDSWQTIENLTSESSDQRNPCVAVDGNDYIHIVWRGKYAGSPTYIQVRYRKYTNSWQANENLTADSYNQSVASIGIDKNDYLHVIWVGSHPGSAVYYQVRYIKYTGSWGEIKTLTNANQDQYSPIAIWAKHPGGRLIPKTEFAFIWVDGTTVKYSAKIELSWLAHYIRSRTALLGLLSTGTRSLALSRSNTALLGLKGIGSRVLSLTRLKTALLGLKATATKSIALTRSQTALLGLKATGTRTIAISRSKIALLGLLGTGSRTIAITRSGVALLGLKATGVASTVGHYVREGIAYLGLVATGTRSLALTRSKTALLGLKGAGTRLVALTRAGTALLGLKSTGTRVISYTRIQTALLGLKTTGTRTIAITRAKTALLGLKATGLAVLPSLGKLVVKVVTLQYRNIIVGTYQHRLIKIITSQYRKIRTLLLGE